MATLTSANSVFTLTVLSVFPSPQTLQGYATDDMFSVDGFQSVETAMGVDGYLSAGYTPMPKVMTVTLQADSPSLPVFDNWFAAQRVIKDAIVAAGILTVPSLRLTHTLVRGFLSSYTPLASARKILQPRAMQITWQDIITSPQL